jgi:hypothetical protein
MRAAEARGEVAEGTASRWAHHTPGGIKRLPERKGKKKMHRGKYAKYARRRHG